MKVRFFGIFALSLSLLLFELTLVRVYSATLFYHFAFMALSVAMLGLAAAGLVVHRYPTHFQAEDLGRWGARYTALYAISVPVVLFIAFRIPVNAYLPPNQIGGKLAVIYILSAIPFGFAGLVVSGLFASRPREIGALYAWDLVGAGLGALTVIPLLNWAGGESAAFYIALIGLAAALCFSTGRRQIVVVLLGLLILTAGVTNDRFGWLKIVYSKGQRMSGLDVRYSKWNSISRILAIPFKPGTDAVYTWCPSPRYPLPIMEHLSLLIDDGAATPVLPFDGRNLAPINYLIYDLTSLAHRLKGNGETLVIGCGGGRDVLTGLITGAERIDAVDVNPLIFDAMNNALGQFNGYLYKHPKVRAIVSEGRAFARRNPGKYDLLQVAMIDTWAATTAGAYALSENNLYTVEAFEDYLRALKPGGIFSFTRFFFTPPRQALRLVSLYLEAASRLGIERPDQGILIARYESLATLIFKGEPFTSDEINRFRHDIADLGFELVYAPDARPDPHFRTLIESRNREAFYASYPFDVSPSIDERPFFFNMLKMKDFLRVFEIREGQKFNYYATYTLLWLLILSIASTLLVIFLPLLVWGERISGLPGRGWLLTYFAGIGLAYIMIETVLIQRFMLLLENPVYSAGAVVALMLIASGSGSLFFSPRQTSDFKIIGSRKFEWHVLAFAVIALFAMLHIFQGASINSWALSMPMGVRVALIVLLLLPLGFAMGIPLPAGMQFAAPGGPSTIAWCWAVNGAASVVASPFAVALSMGQGFRVSLTWAFIFYGIAFGALMMLRLTYHQPIERTVD